MRLICINDNFLPAPGSEDKDRPKFLDEDIVTAERYSYKYGGIYYNLQRFGDETWYGADHFATLPDQTADETEEERQEAIVNLETVLP